METRVVAPRTKALIDDVLDKGTMSLRDVSRSLEISYDYLRCVAKGHQIPSLELAGKIALKMGIEEMTMLAAVEDDRENRPMPPVRLN